MHRAIKLLAIVVGVLLLEPHMSAEDSRRLPVADTPGALLDRTGLVKTFADEFDTFDRKTWLPSNFYEDDSENRIRPWAGEKQFYVDAAYRGPNRKPLGLDPFHVEDGALVITAKKTPSKLRRVLEGYRYTSGWISTIGTFSQQYGYFEARMRVPAGRSFWAAFWLLPLEADWPPEIDVMEILGREPDVLHVNVHTDHDGEHETHPRAFRTLDLSKDFHVYGVDWGPKEIVFYLNDREVHRTPTPPDLHRPCYMIANLAMGGGWAKNPNRSTPLPSTMEIDWIRVWRRAA